MSALEILDRAFREAYPPGLNLDPAQLDVACNYIDNQKDPDAFSDFVEQAVQDRVQDHVRQQPSKRGIPVSFSEDEIKFLIFTLGYTHGGKDNPSTPPDGRAFLEKMHWQTLEKLINTNAEI